MGVRAAGRDHLHLLSLAHAFARIEHAAARARHVEKTFQRGLARVAAGRYKDEDFALLAVLLRAERQQVRQKLERHVLKRERRPVPEFQRMRPCADRADRGDLRVVKARAICPGDGVFQLVRREIGQKLLQNRQRTRLIVKRGKRGDFIQRKMRKGLRHIQSAVRRKPAQNGRRFRNRGRAAGGKHRHVYQSPFWGNGWGAAPNPTKNLRFLDFPYFMNQILIRHREAKEGSLRDFVPQAGAGGSSP